MSNFIIPLLSILTDREAYLDPGTGSFLLQLLIAAFAGLGIVIATQWNKIKQWFGNKKTKTNKKSKIEKDDGS